MLFYASARPAPLKSRTLPTSATFTDKLEKRSVVLGRKQLNRTHRDQCLFREKKNRQRRSFDRLYSTHLPLDPHAVQIQIFEP